MAKKRSQRKVRVDFRQNRQVRRRRADWTRRYHEEDDTVTDSERSESVRAKGDLSRKRTVIVDDSDLPVGEASQWRVGVVTKVHGLICFVDTGEPPTWECTVRRVLRTRLIENRAPVTVGDRVRFSDQSNRCDGEPIGVIEGVEPRRTFLARRDRRKRAHAIVANADQLLAVVSIAQPRLRPHLVDRYIVAALKGGLEPILCFNKIDLLADDVTTEDADEHQGGLSVRAVIAEFRALGYRCLETSATDGTGIDALAAQIEGKMTVLSGQSGVGKSSLINAIQPGLELPTRTVSAETEKGRHTTTLAELLPLEMGGYVVDTPGIRAFDLWNIDPGELEALFVEFVPRVPNCRFGNCSHRGEEGCAVLAAVEAGEISPRRYFSYLKMLEDA
jgi:ribosome biogenesis GTPase